MRHKIFILFLALAASTGTMFASVTIDGIAYNLNDQQLTAEVTSGGDYSGSVVIPKSVTYNAKNYSVKSIGYEAFRHCYSLTSVTIPNSVTSIGESAFAYCSSLTSVTIPNSVTSIGESAFEGCIGLTSIEIPNSVTSIGNYAFFYCTGLTIINYIGSIEDWCNKLWNPSEIPSQYDLYFNNEKVIEIAIPSTVTSIGYRAFSGCRSFTSVTIPNSVTSIGDYAFYECGGLISVTIPNGVTSIGIRAFSNCAGLTSVSIPNSVSSIGSKAFYECSDLTSVTLNSNAIASKSISSIFGSQVQEYILGNNVISIGNGAFSNCTGLTSVTIPYSVTSIGNSAFSGCKSLTSIEIPNSVRSIGDYAFNNCSSLTSVTLNSNAIVSKSYNKNISSIFGSQVQEYILGNSVTNIGDHIFEQYYSLISIKISNSVTSIGEHAFRMCSGLTSIEIPNSVTSIGDAAFHLCSRLTSVTIEAKTPPTLGSGTFLSTNNCPIYIPCGTLDAYKKSWSDYSSQIKYEPLEYVITGKVNIEGAGNVQLPQNICESIIAIPNYGYHFAQWSDGNTDNPRTFVLTQDTTFTAEFVKNAYTITTESSNIAWGATVGDTTALYLDKIAISAVAKYGYHFERWNDGATANPRTITITEDKKYQAIFAKNVYSITKITQLEQGSISGPSQAEYLDNVTLTANPNYGYHFAQWSDGNTENPRTFVLTHDTIFNAEFAKNEYTITTESIEPGWGTFECVNSALYLDEIAISAIPNYGYHFTQWSDGNTDNPRRITIIRDTTFQAVFAKNTYSVTKNAEHGTIGGNDYAEYLDEVTLTVNPDYGYHFTQWSDGNTDNPRTFVLTLDTTFTAKFAYNPVIHYVFNSNYGQVLGDTITPTGVAEDYITFEAQPLYGYHFAQWSDGITDNPRTIYLTQDTTFTAEFAPNQYNINVTCDDVRGSIEGESGVFDYMTEKTYEAIPNYGYHFAQWSDGNTDNPRTITITKNISISAVFAKNTYTIIDKTDPTQGYIYGAGTYEYLDEISLTPVNEYGYHFVQWSDGLTDSQQTIVLTKDTAFAAEFAIDKNGTCGANNMLNWVFDDQEKVLTISGNGTLDDNYTYGLEAPTQMKKLIIGEEISVIGNSAFYGSSRLMKIHFGKAIETIGSNAFRKCPYILEIHAPMDYPPIIDGSVFAECGDLSGIDCYVSEESLSLYKKTDVWSSFNLLVESSHEAVDNISADQPKAIKFMRNGQILILRGEKVYTITGQEVR